MNVAQKRLSLGTLWLGTVATILLLVSVSQAQSSQTLSAHSSSPQSAHDRALVTTRGRHHHLRESAKDS